MSRIQAYHLSGKKWFSFSKRQQFAFVSLTLSGVLFAITFIPAEFRLVAPFLFALITYLLCVFVIREDVAGIEWITLFVLPTFFALSVSLFYFFLPSRLITRIPLTILFSIGMYAALLTENIYNVAATRSIQLLRAAYSVGFLLTLITVFLLVSNIFALHLPSYFNFLLVFIVAFPLSFQLLWSVLLTPQATKSLLIQSFTISLLFGEIGFVLSFWPIKTTIESLFITTLFYAVSGLMQQGLLQRLFRKTIYEFLGVLGIVFILVLVTTQWG